MRDFGHLVLPPPPAAIKLRRGFFFWPGAERGVELALFSVLEENSVVYFCLVVPVVGVVGARSGNGLHIGGAQQLLGGLPPWFFAQWRGCWVATEVGGRGNEGPEGPCAPQLQLLKRGRGLSREGAWQGGVGRRLPWGRVSVASSSSLPDCPLCFCLMGG